VRLSVSVERTSLCVYLFPYSSLLNGQGCRFYAISKPHQQTKHQTGRDYRSTAAFLAQRFSLQSFPALSSYNFFSDIHLLVTKNLVDHIAITYKKNEKKPERSLTVI